MDPLSRVGPGEHMAIGRPAPPTMASMPAPGGSPARALRAAAVSLWATLLAVVAHVAGSGEAPPLVAVVPVVAASAGLTWLATARRIGFGAALALLAAPQVAIHLLSGYLHGHQVVPSGAMLATHLVGLAVMAIGVAVAEWLWWAWWSRLALVLRRRGWVRPLVRTPLLPRSAAWSGASLLDHIVVRRGPPFSRIVAVPVSRIRG